MGHPKDLLKQQEITFDNHHPGTTIKWDDDLHFHKKLKVPSLKGKPVNVSGVFHLAKNKDISVTRITGRKTITETTYYAFIMFFCHFSKIFTNDNIIL